MCLADESEHLGMTAFAENNNLFSTTIVLLFNASLELEHHRTGGVDDLDIVPLGQFISLRRFAMRT